MSFNLVVDFLYSFSNMSKSKPKMRALALACILILVSISTSQAQRIDKYNVSTFTGGYSTIINQGGVVPIYQLPSSSTVYYQDIGITMPINFKYDNTSYTAGSSVLYVAFGQVAFQNVNANYQNIIRSSVASSYPNAICPLTGLQVVYNSGANYPSTNNGGVYYLVTGSSPNRVMTIEWNKMGDYPSSSVGTQSYQLKLYESNNEIEFIYEKYNQAIDNSSYQASYYPSTGLNSSSSPSFIQVTQVTSTTNSGTPSSNYRFQFLPNVQMSTNPKSLNYGNQFTGLYTDYYVRVTHVGTEGLLNVLSASIGGANPGDFKIMSPATLPTGIPIGGYVDFVVRFSPVGGGNRNATFTVISNGVDSGTQSTTLTGYGVAPAVDYSTNLLFKGAPGRRDLGDSAEQFIVVRSTGVASLFVDPVIPFVFTGDGASDYSVSRAPKNPIAGGGDFDTLKIKFKPTAEGARIATLTLNTNAANLPVYQVTLKGVGLLPHIAVSTNYMKFDSSVSAGSTVCQTLKIYNSGSDSLRILRQYFSSNDGDFTMDMLTGQAAVIPGQDSTSIQVCFTPKQVGTRQARIRFATNIPKTYQQPPQDTSFLDVEVRGNGVYYGTFQTSANVSDSTQIAVEYCHSDSVWNTGKAAITVTSATITGPDAALFSLTMPPVPFTIAPGSFATDQVCISPPDLMTYNTTLTLNGVTNGKPVTASLNYMVTSFKKKNTITPKLLFSGDDLAVGDARTSDVSVTNEGSRTVSYSASVIKGDDYSLASANQIVLAPGETGMFTVRFSPLSEGAKSGSLLISPSEDKNVTIGLAGSGHNQEQTSSVRMSNSQDGFSLSQNVPNPATGVTNIPFVLPRTAHVRIALFDMTGKEVREIVSSTFAEGSHMASLSTHDIPSGSYIYVLESEGTRISQSMVITK